MDNREKTVLKDHWNRTYTKRAEDKLGWYETDLSPTLRLISKTGLARSAIILNVGAGSTTLIDKLLDDGYSNIVATDISEVALTKLESRVGSENIVYIQDDLTAAVDLYKMEEVDLWIDRAVVHFFVDPGDQEAYFDLLKKKVKQGGYVILAQFSLDGANTCSGLPVQRYSKEMFVDKLGAGFELIDSFDHIYTMPSGDTRPYIYALFKRV